MSRKVNPYLVIALAGVGVWAFMQYRRSRGGSPLTGLPTPPELPFPEGEGYDEDADEVPTSPEGAANLELWRALDFDVDVFPAAALKQSMAPPRKAEESSIAPGCSAIAVGHGFWAKLRAQAQPLFDEGMGFVAAWQELREVMFPGLSVGPGGPPSAFEVCLSQGAPAARMVELEILKRLRFQSGPFLTTAPAKNPGTPSALDALVFQLRGRGR